MDNKSNRAVSVASRRQFMAGAGTVGAAALAGCLGEDDNGNGGIDADPVDEITYLHFETSDDRRVAISDLADDFEASSGIDVRQRVVHESDLATELTTAVASNTLANTGALSLAVLHAAVQAVDNESPGRVIEEIGPDRFYDNILDMVRTPDGDGYYGVPLYTWPQLTIYRTELFEERGLPRPETWDDILDVASELHDPDNNEFGIVTGTEVDQYTLQCFTGFALSNNARVFDEDGNIVFDSDEMIEALDFYGQLAQYTPPGAVDAGSIGPAYNNEQTHLYSGNSFSLYFNTFGVEEGELMTESVVPSITNEREATYGEVVSTATFTGQSDGEIVASEEWQGFLRGTEDINHYIRYCHMQPGGFQPVLEDVFEMDDYRNNEVIEKWPDEITEEVLPNAIRSAERFGFRDGNIFPEIGPITGNFMIARAVRDVVDGEDARTVAENAAEEMRDRVN